MRRFLSLYLPVQDLRLLRIVGRWALTITPFVGIEEDLKKTDIENSLLRRGLLLDISGTSRLYPSELSLAQRVVEELSEKNIPIAIGIASTLGASWAFSRFSASQIYIHSTTPLQTAVTSFPLAALRLSQMEIASINEVGIFTIGDILILPAKQIGHRFGLNILKRIDQLLGRVEEPLRLLKFSEQVSAIKRFNIPLSKKESLKKCIQNLLINIFEKIEKKSLKASSFQLKFLTVTGHTATRNISLHLASESLTHVTSIIDSTIDALKFDEAVTIVEVIALDLRPHTYGQPSALDPGAAESFNIEKSFGEYLNTITQKIGKNSITRPAFVSSYTPEASFKFVPFTDAGGDLLPSMGDRPSTIFPKPELIKVIAMLPDRPPSWLNWRGVPLKTVQGIGPERIHGEWWNSALHQAGCYRDYFRVQDEKGRWLWIFRDSPSLEWFVHGIWT